MLKNDETKHFLEKQWRLYLTWFYETSTTIVISIFLLCLIPLIIWVDFSEIASLKNFIGVLLERGEVIALLAATLLYFKEAPNRKKREHYEAWLVINSASQQGGSGGRISALEDLNKDQVSLENLTVIEADLTEINLEKADLTKAVFLKSRLKRANFQEAVLVGANLEDTILMSANLEGAILSNANLKGADLRLVNLKNAVLVGVNLEEATLTGANLEGAILTNANLQNAILNKVNFRQAKLNNTNLKAAILDNSIFEKADLTAANLEKAVLHKVNFMETNLGDVNFNETNLEGANLANALNLTEEQIIKARICQTLLPPDFTIKNNRDFPLILEQFTKENQELSEDEKQQLLRLNKFIEIASQDGKISQDEMETIFSLITLDHRINIQELKIIEELIEANIDKKELDSQ